MQTFAGLRSREFGIERKWRECRLAQIAPINTFPALHLLPRSY